MRLALAVLSLAISLPTMALSSDGRIASSLPLEGPNTIVGLSMKRALEKYINVDGSIELIILSDDCSPARIVENIERAASQYKVDIFIGSPCQRFKVERYLSNLNIIYIETYPTKGIGSLNLDSIDEFDFLQDDVDELEGIRRDERVWFAIAKSASILANTISNRLVDRNMSLSELLYEIDRDRSSLFKGVLKDDSDDDDCCGEGDACPEKIINIADCAPDCRSGSCPE